MMRTLIILNLLLVPTIAAAGKVGCPKPVLDAIDGAYPKATVLACKQEKEDGRTLFEAKVKTADGRKLELDVSPEGKVLQSEEVVAQDTLPEVVRSAFAARYPGVKADRAERMITGEGKVSFEISFHAGKARKAATFAEDGAFVEEE